MAKTRRKERILDRKNNGKKSIKANTKKHLGKHSQHEQKLQVV